MSTSLTLKRRRFVPPLLLEPDKAPLLVDEGALSHVSTALGAGCRVAFGTVATPVLPIRPASAGVVDHAWFRGA